MTPNLRSMVSATYVRSIPTSRAFYELLGFEETSAGSAATAAWSYLSHNGHLILLASSRPPLNIPRLPLLFYFFIEELDSAIGVLESAGVTVQRVGNPPHALGGEVKVTDPDGNTVLLGQRERSASQEPLTPDETTPQFSLLREAAALVEARGGAAGPCEVTNLAQVPCPEKADVKLTDSWGDTVWACMGHAEEILVAVPGAYIASEAEQGLSGFVSSRR